MNSAAIDDNGRVRSKLGQVSPLKRYETTRVRSISHRRLIPAYSDSSKLRRRAYDEAGKRFELSSRSNLTVIDIVQSN